MGTDRRRPEILAPAGNMTCLQAAIDAGADAAYLGLGKFNMRARSSVNFSPEELPEAAARAHAAGVKLYLTLNSIIFESELDAMRGTIAAAAPHVDAFIVSDLAAMDACRAAGAAFHVSTQMSCSNSVAARALKAMGASRVVLARECTLAEAAAIARDSGIEIETFVHGAQCVAESGRCFMSHEAYGKSANRGECRQPCRRKFLVRAVDRWGRPGAADASRDAPPEFIVGPHTVLSAKDLCSLPFVDRLVDAGIASFKIEGRARNPEYVRETVSAYREAADAAVAGTFTRELADRLVERVSRVFHREFSTGLFFGRPGTDQFTDKEDSVACTVKRHCGIVTDYFAKAGMAQVQVQDAPIACGDLIQIHGSSTGVVELRVPGMRRDGETPAVAEKGTWVTFACPRVRRGDKVFRIDARG